MNRRGFLGSILAAGMAPAIVRASSMMKIFSPAQIIVPRTGLLTPGLITAEALRILDYQLTSEEFKKRYVIPSIEEVASRFEQDFMMGNHTTIGDLKRFIASGI